MELAWPSLRVKLSFGHHKGSLICSVLSMVGVPVDASGMFLLDFPVPRGVVDADVEYCASTEGRERRFCGGGFGDGLHRALGLGVWILLQDGLEGCFEESAVVQHVDGRRRLVGDLVGERLDISNLVGELAP